MGKRLLQIFCWLFLISILLYEAASASSAFTVYFTASRRGWSVTEREGRFLINGVNSQSPAAALQIGDEIIRLESPLAAQMPINAKALWRVRPETPYQLIINRQGNQLALNLQTYGFSFDEIRSGAGVHIAFILFLLTGLVVFLLKPGDKQAMLFALMMCSFVAIHPAWSSVYLPRWIVSTMIVIQSLGFIFLPLLLHFFLIFPRPSPWLNRWPRLEFWLYVPALVWALPYLLKQNALGWFSPELARKLFPEFIWNRYVFFLVLASYVISALASLVINYRAASDADRRKLRVVVAGSSIGMIDILLVASLDLLGLRKYPAIETLWQWLDFLSLFTMPLIPLSFAYAIIRHQVIPVRMLVRRGVRYLLVSRGAVILEAITVWVALTIVLSLIFRWLRPPGSVIGLVSATVGIVVWNTTRRLHERFIAPYIDRHFFRDAYDAQLILSDLNQAVRATPDLTQLLRLVATRIQSALHAENVTIFLRDEPSGNYESRLTANYDELARRTEFSTSPTTLPGDSFAIRQLKQSAEPINVDLSNPNSPLFALWMKQLESNNPHRDELSTLERLQTTLLPLTTRDELLGFISLGPRLGDLPYSSEDERLLTSVAGPTTFAIENARLVERMLDEARRRQVIEADHQRKTAELNLARQLQLSMLPKENVRLNNLEITGAMRTTTEVGGDYYDFIPLEDGRWCMAIGDATGHGMAAGLVVGMVRMGLMSGLQSLNGKLRIKPLIEDLNAALKQSLTQRGLGMCFGAAIIDPRSLLVELSSSGMPFPYHYQHSTAQLIALKLQSPPLGFLKRISVSPVSVQLQPGDALVWLSDGFEERMNPAGEIWSTEQVESALLEICRREASAEVIAQRLIECCDQAASGRSNDDDMTVVILKIHSAINRI